MNPNWVELAQTDQAGKMTPRLDLVVLPDVATPRRLWAIIEATAGGFEIDRTPALAGSGA